MTAIDLERFAEGKEVEAKLARGRDGRSSLPGFFFEAYSAFANKRTYYYLPGERPAEVEAFGFDGERIGVGGPGPCSEQMSPSSVLTGTPGESTIRPAAQGFPPVASDRGELGADRGDLPAEIRLAVQELGPRPRKEKFRPLILRLCSDREWRAAEQAQVLGLSDVEKLVERHLGPLCEQHLLERRFPDNPKHPQQAYRAVGTASGAKKP